MKAGGNLLAVAAIAVCCLVVWFCASIKGSPKTYEVQPWITVPEYRTEAARAMDAYERLMDRYVDLTERSLFNVSTDVREVLKKLDGVDQKLIELCTRIARIEKTLGIEQPAASIEAKPQPTPPDNTANEKSSASPIEIED